MLVSNNGIQQWFYFILHHQAYAGMCSLVRTVSRVVKGVSLYLYINYQGFYGFISLLLDRHNVRS